MSDEWYRSSAWTETDQEHFEEKLQRARPGNRAQYIRLKALALAASKRRTEKQAVPELLERVIREHADDELQAAMAWADLGQFYAEQGEHELAAHAFRCCLDAEAALDGICAWERDLWIEYDPRHYEEHRLLLAALEVPTERTRDGVLARWTATTARAYQLLHVFLHELGHHHDRMTTDSAHATARGEAYAEQYALRYAERIWDAYRQEFGW